MNKIVFSKNPSLPNTACYTVLLSVYLVKNLVDNLPPPKAMLKVSNPESLNDAPCFVLDHSNLKQFVANVNSEPRFGNAFSDDITDQKELKLNGAMFTDLTDIDTSFLITDVKLFDSGIGVGLYRVFYTVGDVTVPRNGSLNKHLCDDRQNIYFTQAVRYTGRYTDATVKELMGFTTTPKYTKGRGWVIDQLLRYIDALNSIDFNPDIFDVIHADSEQKFMDDEEVVVKLDSQQSDDDRAFEQKIVDKGLLAPRVTVDDIEKLMAQVSYSCHIVEGTNTTIAVAILPIGEKMFTLDFGMSSPASNANFNAELGEEAAIKDATAKARNKLWELEGYRLAHSLAFP